MLGKGTKGKGGSGILKITNTTASTQCGHWQCLIRLKDHLLIIISIGIQNQCPIVFHLFAHLVRTFSRFWLAGFFHNK